MKVKSDIEKTKRDWEARYKKGWGGGTDLVFADFLKKYKTKLGPKVLDIGSGEGRHVAMLAKAGLNVIGLELAENGIKTAVKNMTAKKLKADFILGDAHSLPFIGGYFDSVLSIQVFQFNDWKGAEQCFSEASRVIKKDGLFYLRVKAAAADVPKGNRLVKNDRGATYKTPDGNTAHFYTARELVSLGNKFGLKAIEAPFDAGPDRKPGQWNVIYRKVK